MVLGLLAGCASSPADRGAANLPDRKPDVSGTILQIDVGDGGALVLRVEHQVRNGAEQDNVTVDGATQLLAQDATHAARPAQRAELQPMSRVELWYSGPAPTAYPREARAAVVRLDAR